MAVCAAQVRMLWPFGTARRCYKFCKKILPGILWECNDELDDVVFLESPFATA
jgi:hypothetical protein